MKKTLMILGAILLAVLVAAGSFWGGMTYQSNQTNQVRANFFNSRGGEFIPNNGQFPGQGQLPNGNQGAGFSGGGRTTGQVKSIEGNVMTVSTAQDVTTVNLSETTQIQKSETAAVADLQPGVQVMVTGQRDADGNITASQVLILNTELSGMPNPDATRTAP
jgi:hypothetical protein